MTTVGTIEESNAFNSRGHSLRNIIKSKKAQEYIGKIDNLTESELEYYIREM
jgi:hypothetical protein